MRSFRTPIATVGGAECTAARAARSLQPVRRSRFGSVRLWLACCGALLLAGFGHQAQAQARPAGVRAADVQVGGGFTYARSDFGTPPYLRGGTFYASFDFKPNYGIELDFHQLNGPSGTTAYNQAGYDKIYNRDYEVGGRYVRHYGIFNPYARVMYGRGVFNYQADLANLAYNMGVVGAGVDINVHRHINVRADYEYQHWFGFHGQLNPNAPSDSLTPQLFTVGVAYHFE